MRGFSYIEIIITVAILALLATAAVPYLELTTTRQKEADLNRNLREIREAIDRYKRASDEGHIPRLLEDSGYPKRLEDLSDGIEDAQDPKKIKSIFCAAFRATPCIRQKVNLQKMRLPRKPGANVVMTARQTNRKLARMCLTFTHSVNKRD